MFSGLGHRLSPKCLSESSPPPLCDSTLKSCLPSYPRVSRSLFFFISLMATTSTRVISGSRKRARLNDTIRSLPTTASEDVSASQAAQNTALSLPTELIYTILAISIGDYIGDMMLNPSKLLHWDAILTLLHVSRSFRGSTIKLLYHLWGETFIRERTK